MAIKRGCSIGLFLLICSTFTSCNFLKVNKVSEQDFIGIWKENSKSCQNNLPDCAWFEFMKDGYFKAGHIPNEYFGYTPTFSGTFDSTGKWNIELTSDPFGNHKIRLRFDPVPAMGYPIYNDILYVRGKKGNYELFKWHGDESDEVSFSLVSTKQDNK